MALDPRLLDILACPQDKGPLLYFPEEGYLYNPRLRCCYEVLDDIPVMLVEEASYCDEETHNKIMTEAESQEEQKDVSA